jgi:ABC-2 type transport system permease protein
MMVTLLPVMTGGAWVPAFVLPCWLPNASSYLPTRSAVGGLDGATWRGLPFDAAVLPTLLLIGAAAACLLVAIWPFRLEE